MVGIILVLLLALIILYMMVYTKKIKSKSSRHDANHAGQDHNVHHKSDSGNEKSKFEYTKNGNLNEARNLFSKPESQLDEYATSVMQIIKKEKRTTQKELRKEIPLSEAKISLIVSDLEDKGKIRKIKKGRGNILIFVKD